MLPMYKHPRAVLVEYLQRLYDMGMTTTSGGNLSILDDEGNIWITPSGIDKGALRERDIMKVFPDGTVEGLHRPSVEFPFHQHIYQIRKETGVRAVLHAHAPGMVAFSLVKRVPDTSLLPGADAICGKVAFAKYAIPGSAELGDLIAAEIAKGADCVVMENHGAVVCGLSIEDCFRRYETLEQLARLQIAAVGNGKPAAVSAKPALRNLPEFEAESVSSKECELRERLAWFHERCYRHEYFTSAHGLAAARLGADDFLITPAGADAANLEPEDFVRVCGGKREAYMAPNALAPIVRKVFKKVKWAEAVYLMQGANIMAFATTGELFNSRMIPESYLNLRDVPRVTAEEFLCDTDAAVAKLSVVTPVLLIEGVGLLTVGKSLIEAFDRMEVGEFTAKCILLAKRLGKIAPITQKQVDEFIDAFHLPRA